MSEQEVGAAMAAAAETQTPENVPPQEPAQESAPQPTNTIPVTDCISVYDYVVANSAMTSGWKKMKLVGDDGVEVTDTKNVLVGVADDGTPVAFSCKNLMIPTADTVGITSIKVLISGIIMIKPDASIYVSKNNVYVFKKDTNGNRNTLVTYTKVKGDSITYTETPRDASVTVDADYVKLIAKTNGGRIYALVEELSDIAAMKEALIKFLNEKVSDINYCIKIENILLGFGF